VGEIDDRVGWDTRFALNALERVRLDGSGVVVEMVRRAVDEVAVREAGMDDLAGDAVRERDVGADVEAQPHVGPLCRGGAPRIHDVQAGSMVHALQHMVEEDGVRLPRVRPPEQDHVRFFNLAVRTGTAARPKDRRQTDDAGGVSSPVAAVDVVAPYHRANELLGNIVQLVGSLGATKHAEGPRVVLLDPGSEALGNAAERLVP